MLLARDSMIPALKAAKSHAQTGLAEIGTLNRLAQASGVSGAPRRVRPGV